MPKHTMRGRPPARLNVIVEERGRRATFEMGAASGKTLAVEQVAAILGRMQQVAWERERFDSRAWWHVEPLPEGENLIWAFDGRLLVMP